jgi:hypothetical protein
MVVGLSGCAQGNARHTLEVQVHMEPPAEAQGGNVFLTGFEEVDSRTGHPSPGSSPAAHLTLGMFVYQWPLVTRVELVEGLHYFAMVGFQQWPSPGDRMSEMMEITGSMEPPLRFVVGNSTRPADHRGASQ